MKTANENLCRFYHPERLYFFSHCHAERLYFFSHCHAERLYFFSHCHCERNKVKRSNLIKNKAAIYTRLPRLRLAMTSIANSKLNAMTRMKAKFIKPRGQVCVERQNRQAKHKYNRYNSIRGKYNFFPFPKKIYKIRFTFLKFWFTIEYAIYNVGECTCKKQAYATEKIHERGGR